MNRAAFLRLLGLTPLAATLKPKAKPSRATGPLPTHAPARTPIEEWHARQLDVVIYDEAYGLSTMEQMNEAMDRLHRIRAKTNG